MKNSNNSNEEMYLSMGISKTVYDYGCAIEKSLRERFDEVDRNAEYNQLKVVKAMQQHQVSEACLLGTTGYGYNDLGRETLEAVYAAVFHTEAALVRPQITCGTHALALALAGNLRPGDEMISISGKAASTTDADGNTTYTDAENAAAEAALRAAAESLVSDEIDSPEALDAAIAALSINADEESAASTASTNIRYSSLNSAYQDWVSDSNRKAGDKKVFESTTTNDDGTESLSGCYVVYYDGSTDNEFPMVNVRHILVKPAHPTDEAEDAHTDDETYSAEEWAAAKATAEEIYNQWKSGEATEDSFAALANEKSDDGDGTTGGLYQNVTPGQMVQAFNDWCFDSSRKSGDTGIVETQYGYHVMYFVGTSDITYRTSLIESDLRSADVAAWQEELVNALTISDGDTSYIRTDLVINANGQ